MCATFSNDILSLLSTIFFSSRAYFFQIPCWIGCRPCLAALYRSFVFNLIVVFNHEYFIHFEENIMLISDFMWLGVSYRFPV